MFVRIKPDQVDAFKEENGSNAHLYEQFFKDGQVQQLGFPDDWGDRYIIIGGSATEPGAYLRNNEVEECFDVVDHEDFTEYTQTAKVSQALEMLQYLETNGAISLDGTDSEFIKQTLKQYLKQ